MMDDTILTEVLADFRAGRLNCAEAVFTAVCRVTRQPEGLYPRVATPFGGGLCGLQDKCGALTGSLMSIGLIMGRETGGDKQPAYQAGRAFIAWFQENFICCDCRALTGCDTSDPAQAAAFRRPGGKHDTVCVPMVEACIQKLTGMLED